MTMGPAIIVSGCVRATELGHDDEAFDLEGAGPAQSLGEAAAPQGVNGYRLSGSAADLKRHAGQRVEVIGVVQSATSAGESTTLTLDAKSLRTTDDKCSR
jgi:hypothetical protein